MNYNPRNKQSKKYLCRNCTNRNKCIEACKALNNYLRKQGIYADSWIRPKMSSDIRYNGRGMHREVPFSSVGMISEGKD